MNCPFCQSTEYIKNGMLKAGQRYLCKSCRRTFTQSEKADPASKEKRRLGLIMYLQGFGVTSIGRQLGVSHVTVIKWVTKYGKSFDEIRFHDPSAPQDPSIFRPGA